MGCKWTHGEFDFTKSFNISKKTFYISVLETLAAQFKFLQTTMQTVTIMKFRCWLE